MTLEERLQKRLQSWRSEARNHREAMAEGPAKDEEWWMHKLEAETFERCAGDLAADLSARSTPSPSPLPGGV